MKILNYIKEIFNTEKNSTSFIIEPLEIGQGITLGNALRRTLFSDLEGYTVNTILINDIKHEFTNLDGIREDILEILLNIKDIIIKNKNITSNKNFFANLNIKGPSIITAGMLNLSSNELEILNPELYLCTISNNLVFNLKLTIVKEKGYQFNNDLINNLRPINSLEFNIDSSYSPIRKIIYKIKFIYNSKGFIKESLHITIKTNGAISPTRALKEGFKSLINLLYNLLNSSNNTYLNNKFLKT